ncbi:hypothetical protein [Halarchaeum nitratireducens]|uniref:hypothetical protein n=1 Tax=Halarchaeum nitratireducens TaxID=489913 RepID=UPI001669310C|nr:hypothetical protein [Halarchaeum nitratireducens]
MSEIRETHRASSELSALFSGNGGVEEALSRLFYLATTARATLRTEIVLGFLKAFFAVLRPSLKGIPQAKRTSSLY